MFTNGIIRQPALNVKEILFVPDHSCYIEVCCNSATNKLSVHLIDPESTYKPGIQVEVGQLLMFHIIYKKLAIWVRAERPSLNDIFTIHHFITKKPIGSFSNEVPITVRFDNATYYEGCKHYIGNCPNQVQTYTKIFPNNNILLRECLIQSWRIYDVSGWQGALGDPEEIYSQDTYYPDSTLEVVQT